ncbi:MAG: S8 family serine peptidase [Candidatus Peribacteria bacterium]|nr:S8 family serine peptidase [Candidatus Peribacteria bacterium]
MFITAAGNNKNNNDSLAVYPCNFNLSNENIICVAAHGSSNQLSSFSNYGTSVNISAPGENIYSTINSFGYKYDNGTSMATPHVVGAFSLLWNYRPDLTAQQIKDKIYEGSEKVTNYYGPIENNKRLNLFNTLKLIDNKSPIFTEINVDTSIYCLNNTITYHLTGIDDIALTGNAYSFDT